LDQEIFKKYFTKFYFKLFELEDHKHLPPKFSYALKDLANFFDIFEKTSKTEEEFLKTGNSFSSDSSFTNRFKENLSQSRKNTLTTNCATIPKNENLTIMTPLENTVCVNNEEFEKTPTSIKSIKSSTIQIRVPLRRGYFGSSGKRSIMGYNSVLHQRGNSSLDGYKLNINKKYTNIEKYRPNTTCKFHNVSVCGTKKNTSFHTVQQSSVMDNKKRHEESMFNSKGNCLLNNTINTLWEQYEKSLPASNTQTHRKYVKLSIKDRKGNQTKATCILGNRFNLLNNISGLKKFIE